MSNKAKVNALRDVLNERDPFCKGVCSVPEQQLLLYYGQETDLHRINFAHSTTEELETLSQACQPASFGFNNQEVLDESYRKAGKMDLDAFVTSFDPRSVGIHDVIERDLLATDRSVEFELYKLNVYGKDGFFKAHQDTPRGDSIGGQLSLRHGDNHWITDFTDQFAAAAEPSICFVAFYSDVEHQVLPITSGHRVTLTYNLHFRTQSSIPRALSGPFYDTLKARLTELIDDADTLPNGGYLGIGLCHQYAYDETKRIDSLFDGLKGADATLANVCKELELPCTLRLLYAQEEDDEWPCFHLLSRVKVNGPAPSSPHGNDKRRFGTSYSFDEDNQDQLLATMVAKIGPEDMEGVEIIGRNLDREDLDRMGPSNELRFMTKYFKDPVTQVLEVKEMSSILCETSYAFYGNSVTTERFYASACMVISVESQAQSDRKRERNHAAEQNYLLVIHGGAGTMNRDNSTPEKRAKYRATLTRALKAGHQVLELGGEAMDAAVAAVTVLEDCPLFNAGKGAVFNVAGKNELEASLMLSKPPAAHPAMPPSRRGSSVTLLTRTKNPSHLVRALYLSPGLVPHPMLSGEAAETLGAEHFGIKTVHPSYFWTEARWREHRTGLGLPVEPVEPPSLSRFEPVGSVVDISKDDVSIDLMPKGTVGAVALDVRGCIAAVTSTGGRTNKLVGRIGDTPLMGSGFWAEEWERQGGVLKRTWDRLTGKPALCGVGVSGTGDGDVWRKFGSYFAERLS
ncbi:nucleophile aminohydrolase [Chiua virens]|nr:nucleophile aminohydrolase [Chiua virens]